MRMNSYDVALRSKMFVGMCCNSVWRYWNWCRFGKRTSDDLVEDFMMKGREWVHVVEILLGTCWTTRRIRIDKTEILSVLHFHRTCWFINMYMSSRIGKICVVTCVVQERFLVNTGNCDVGSTSQIQWAYSFPASRRDTVSVRTLCKKLLNE